MTALEAVAVARPEPASGEAVADPAEIADLRRRCDELEAAARAASDGLDKTAARLSRLLEE